MLALSKTVDELMYRLHKLGYEPTKFLVGSRCNDINLMALKYKFYYIFIYLNYANARFIERWRCYSTFLKRYLVNCQCLHIDYSVLNEIKVISVMDIIFQNIKVNIYLCKEIGNAFWRLKLYIKYQCYLEQKVCTTLKF